MLRTITIDEYIEKVRQLEASESADHAFLEQVRTSVSEALKQRDTDKLLAVRRMFETTEGREICARFASLVQLRFILGAIDNERTLGYPLFSDGTDSFDALIDRFSQVNLMLRRIEFDIEPGIDDAMSFLRRHHISPYAAAAVIYSMTSSLGHREKILLHLAHDALERGDALQSYGFLSVIENASEDTFLLKDELAQAIRGGAG